MTRPRRQFTTEDVVLLLTRLVVLGMGAVAAFAISSPAEMLPWVVSLLVIATAAGFLGRTRANGPWLPMSEAAAAGAVIALGPPADIVLVPYLIAPSIAAGIQFGVGWALASTAAAAVGLSVSALTRNSLQAASLLQWLLITVVAGLLAAWVRRLKQGGDGSTPDRVAYEEAASLLTELRTLVRPLSGGLDPRPLALTLVEEAQAAAPHSAALVAVHVGGECRVVAFSADDRPEGWAEALDKLCLAEGLRTPTVATPGVSAFPIRTAERHVGWLLVGRAEDLSAAETAGIERACTRSALRLDASALFEEVRYLATQAERARLARDMHDGVAQDVAALGLVVDALIEDVADLSGDDLAMLRERISELVTELRLSIHDLRDEGVMSGGLSSAVAEVARRECARNGIAVHLRLEDGPTTLPAQVQSELYRIAEEALVNVRRHSGARNVWVACHSGPGGTVLSVEDDGRGLGPRRADSAGLAIMTERATRLGADLTIGHREPVGTVVRVERVHQPVRAGGPS